MDVGSFLGTVAAGPYSWHLSFPLQRIYFLSVEIFVPESLYQVTNLCEALRILVVWNVKPLIEFVALSRYLNFRRLKSWRCPKIVAWRIINGCSGADRSMRFKSTMLPQRTIPTLPRTDGEICPSVRPASVSGKPSSFANMFYGLSVLQEIPSILLACQHGEFAKERVLFSSLPFVSTVSDCIFRKLRGLMMVVSLDCTKLELLEEVNSNRQRENWCS